MTLERLWRTGEILLRKPEVAAERRNLMYYFREVFPRALPELDRRLRQAWADTGFDPALLGDGRTLPRLRFGTWVGGDRDGHPLVTADTTRETLAELRAGGLLVLSRQLDAPRQPPVPVASRPESARVVFHAAVAADGGSGRARPGHPARRAGRTLETVRPPAAAQAAPSAPTRPHAGKPTRAPPN